jgi:hypothetical protein
MLSRRTAPPLCTVTAITLTLFSHLPAQAQGVGSGDINADGFADLVIGAPDGPAGGEVNVLYGSAAGATGQVIVFTVGLDFPEVGNLGEERGGIYTVRANGTGLRQLTSFQTNGFSFGGDGLILSDDHPSFSPTGSHIVFTSNRDAENLSVPVFEQDFEIYRMTATGSNVVRLTDSPGVDTEPVYSPDGTRIAFASARSGNPGATDGRVRVRGIPRGMWPPLHSRGTVRRTGQPSKGTAEETKAGTQRLRPSHPNHPAPPVKKPKLA